MANSYTRCKHKKMSHQYCFLQFGFSAAEHKALLWQWRATGLDGRIVMAPSTIPTTRNAQPQAPSFQHMCKQFKRFELFFQLEQVKRNGWVWWTMWLRSLASKPPELKKIMQPRLRLSTGILTLAKPLSEAMWFCFLLLTEAMCLRKIGKAA